MSVSYYSYSYWQPVVEAHYVGWVRASSYEEVFAVLASKFAMLAQYQWVPQAIAHTRYHPRGVMYQATQFLKNDRVQVQLTTDWKTGTVPESTYLFVSEGCYWTSSDLWYDVPVAMHEELDAEDTLVWSFAYVMPPVMTLDNPRTKNMSGSLLDVERHAPRCLSLYPEIRNTRRKRK